MAFGMGLAAPQHDNWGSAIWGGAKQAAQNVYQTGKMVVTGQSEYVGCDGKTRTMDVDRGFMLKNLPGSVAGAFRAHTFSMRDPEGFQKFQDTVKNFQSGQHAYPQPSAPARTN